MKKNPGPLRLDLFAQTAPGLEAVTAAELKGLGLKPHKEIGGAAFRGDLEQLYKTNLWLRTASRVVARAGSFYASTFYELERRAKKIPWEHFLPKTGAVGVRVTCRKSRLYHSDAVAERVLSAIAGVAPAGVKLGAGDTSDVDEPDRDEAPDADDRQLFIVRIINDQCEISADTSGALLHRRGYRREVGKAPLRETLAAAMLLASGWKAEPGSDLLDPLCGSGTIPIEAALIARRIPPGINREFQFSKWPSFSAELWNRVRDSARQAVKPDTGAGIMGADRDAGAIEAAKRNAARADVADSVDLNTDSLSDSLKRVRDKPPGWILTNPPYGVRVGEAPQLRNLYAALGVGVVTSGWNLGILSAEDALAGHLGIPLRKRLHTRNGGIPVDFLVTKKVEEFAEYSGLTGVQNGADDV